jgi:hypothetical protein
MEEEEKSNRERSNNQAFLSEKEELKLMNLLAGKGYR